MPGVHAKGMRSLSEPGTAYDDPLLGRNPQARSTAATAGNRRRRAQHGPMSAFRRVCSVTGQLLMRRGAPSGA
jgi:hypothetical protein